MKTSPTPPPPLDPANFDPEALAQQQAEALEERLSELHYEEDELEGAVSLGYMIAQIGAQLLIQEPGFQPDEGGHYLVFDEETCTNCLDLFMQGITHAIIKAGELQIQGDVRDSVIKSLGQDVFIQAKQLMATSLGQDLAPEIGFSAEQLLQWINQQAESALFFYISEFEKEFGPIQNQKELPPEMAKAQQALQEEQMRQQQLLIEQQQREAEAAALQEQAAPPQNTPIVQQQAKAPPTKQAVPSGATASTGLAILVPPPSQEDKWGAMALFLSLLDEPAQAAWMQRFTAEEQQRIIYYGDVSRIGFELNVPSVNRYLLELKDQILKARKTEAYQETQLQRSIEEHLRRLGPARSQQLFTQERLAVQLYLEKVSAPPGSRLRQRKSGVPLSVQQSLLQVLSANKVS